MTPYYQDDAVTSKHISDSPFDLDAPTVRVHYEAQPDLVRIQALESVLAETTLCFHHAHRRAELQRTCPRCQLLTRIVELLGPEYALSEPLANGLLDGVSADPMKTMKREP
jgi:hypothetical protein